MKTLLVTNQYIDIRPDGCYCNFALLGTLENMNVLGELYIVANQQLPDKPAAQPLDRKNDFITSERVKHFRPMNRSISSYFKNKKYNRLLLERLIPGMDLVIGYAPSDNADEALKIAHKYGIPFLTFLVGCPWDSLHNHHRLLARIMAPFSWYSTRQTVRKSEYVHYVTKEFLQRRYPTEGKSLGCSDTNLGMPNPKALQERLQKMKAKQTDEIIKLVTTANIDVRYKGQEYAIKAIAKLKEQGDIRYHYYLVGAGSGDYLRKLCIKLNIKDQIHFEGRKTPEDVMKMLVDSDIYLQPSLQEGLPRAVVEAMSVALPCIGYDTGGMAELLQPEFVVNQKSVEGLVCCLKSLQDKRKYKETAEYNFKKAGEYEHSKLVLQIHRFFAEVREEIETTKTGKTNETDRENSR